MKNINEFELQLDDHVHFGNGMKSFNRPPT